MPTELAPPVTLSANETVVLKKRRRLVVITIDRNGGNIVFSSEDVSIDNATDLDRKAVPGPTTIRPLSPAILATKVGGTGADLATAIAKLGDFYTQFRAEDVAAQTP